MSSNVTIGQIQRPSDNRSYINAINNRFTRKWGTEAGGFVDPLLTGSFGIYFDVASPVWSHLSTVSAVYGKQQTSLFPDTGRLLLESASRGVTIPGKTLNTTEIPGIGGIKFVIPTTIEVDNSVTIKFLEFEGTPVTSIFNLWVRLIKDSKNGLSTLRGTSLSKEEYSTNLLYYTTKGDGVSVQYAALYSGLWPKKDPAELHGHDIESVDRVEIDIDFAFDYVFEDSNVYALAQNKAIEQYESGVSSVAEYENVSMNI